MKKLFLFILLAALPFMAGAQTAAQSGVQVQTLKFGYLSYSEALNAMPDVAIVEKNLADLSAKYDAETKHAEDEFNQKYEEFLDQQADFAPIIRQKRMVELQDLMKKNIQFKEEAKRLLEQARNDAYAPLKQKLALTLSQIGKSRGLAFILNTDNDACPYVDPALGEDLGQAVKDALK